MKASLDFLKSISFVRILLAVVVFSLLIFLLSKDVKKTTVIFVRDEAIWIKKDSLDQKLFEPLAGTLRGSLVSSSTKRTIAFLLHKEKNIKSGLYVLNVNQKKLLLVQEDEQDEQSITDFAWSPRGDYLVYGYKGKLFLYQLASQKTKEITKGPLPSNSLLQLEWPKTQNIYWWEFTADYEKESPTPIGSVAKLNLSGYYDPKNKETVIETQRQDGFLNTFTVDPLTLDIIFSVAEGEDKGIYMLKKGEKAPFLLTKQPAFSQTIRLSLRGEKIIYNCGVNIPQLCTMDIKTKHVKTYPQTRTSSKEQIVFLDWVDDKTILYETHRDVPVGKESEEYTIWKLYIESGKKELFLKNARGFSL